MRETFGEGSVSGSQGADVQLISPNISELQKLLEFLQKDGMLVLLTNRILNLRGELRVFQGFDFKA